VACNVKPLRTWYLNPVVEQVSLLRWSDELPKKSELLFHAVGSEEGLIGREQIFEVLLAVDVQIVVVLQQKEATAFRGLPDKLIELPLLRHLRSSIAWLTRNSSSIAEEHDGCPEKRMTVEVPLFATEHGEFDMTQGFRPAYTLFEPPEKTCTHRLRGAGFHRPERD
jgi:hypothetical protein